MCRRCTACAAGTLEATIPTVRSDRHGRPADPAALVVRTPSILRAHTVWLGEETHPADASSLYDTRARRTADDGTCADHELRRHVGWTPLVAGRRNARAEPSRFPGGADRAVLRRSAEPGRSRRRCGSGRRRDGGANTAVWRRRDELPPGVDPRAARPGVAVPGHDEVVLQVIRTIGASERRDDPVLAVWRGRDGTCATGTGCGRRLRVGHHVSGLKTLRAGRGARGGERDGHPSCRDRETASVARARPSAPAIGRFLGRVVELRPDEGGTRRQRQDDAPNHDPYERPHRPPPDPLLRHHARCGLRRLADPHASGNADAGSQADVSTS
jgi:hypothetical protein